MPRRLIDISVALKAGIKSDPPHSLPKIEYMDHKQGAQDFAMMFPGLKPEQLPNGEGAAMERITFTNWLMPEDGPPPAAYNKQADQRSWIAMTDFFDEIFA